MVPRGRRLGKSRLPEFEEGRVGATQAELWQIIVPCISCQGLILIYTQISGLRKESAIHLLGDASKILFCISLQTLAFQTPLSGL